jgi:hypothetical protein
MIHALVQRRRDAMLAKCELLKRRIAVLHLRAMNDIISIATRILGHTGGYAHWTPHVVAARLGQLEREVATLMHRDFSELIHYGAKSAAMIASHATLRTREAEGDEPPPDAEVGGDDNERAAAVERMRLGSMSREEATEILYSKNPWGMTWEEQLAKSSRLVSNPTAVANELAEGIANDEGLVKLRKRIEPYVENLSASAQRIARTEGLRVGMTAQQKQLDSFDARTDCIGGMKMHCAMAPASAEEHKKRNGKFYRKVSPGHYVADDGEHYPGTPWGHANCMCFGEPVLN